MVASGAHQSCSAWCGTFGAFQNSARFRRPYSSQRTTLRLSAPRSGSKLPMARTCIAFDASKAWKALLELELGGRAPRHACKTPDIALSTAENPTRRHLSRFSTGRLRPIDVRRTLHVARQLPMAGCRARHRLTALREGTCVILTGQVLLCMWTSQKIRDAISSRRTGALPSR